MLSSRGGLASAAPRRLRRLTRSFATSATRHADFTHAVVGGGVVGLAIARQLQRRHGASTVLMEKHGSVGTETSSRNSEVIHAGLYYGADSLKARLCLRGKDLLYQLCQKHAIPHRNTGKWIVAQDAAQREALEDIHRLAARIGVPTHFLTHAEAHRREPDVRAEAGVLESPSTGILDSHSLMQYLQGDFENEGGLCAFRSPVTSITPIEAGKRGWAISTTTAPDGGREPTTTTTTTTITAETLVNAAGLSAVSLSNQILPHDRQHTAFYAKGTYFSYPRSHPRPSTLIYPAPVPGHPGLGIHLTLDLAGRIRFGPDVQWTDNPTDYTPNAHGPALAAARAAIHAYLPAVDAAAIQPDYAGIRPKLARHAAAATATRGATATAFHDFYIAREHGFAGFVNLLAIESPGLTACLAIAEEVEALLYGRVCRDR